MSFVLQTLEYCFKFTCVIVTIFLVVWCGVCSYLENEDMTLISFESFYTIPELVYPSASVCFTAPYDADKLNSIYDITSISEYSDFLGGESNSWNKSMLNVNFQDVSLNPLEYILGYKATYRNMTETIQTLNNLDQPRTRLMMPNMVCYGIDIEMTKEIVAIGIIIKTSIFPNMIRPSHADDLTPMGRGISVILHYSNQILNTKWWKKNWPTRSDQASKSFAITYDIRGVEVIRTRNKRQKPCHENIDFDYDSEVFKEILDNAGCRPPYTTMRKNLAICDTKSKMKEIKENHFKHFSGLNLKYQPCNLLVKVNYEVTERDTEESDPLNFTLNFEYKDDQVKIIQYARMYGLWNLIANVGGYIGMFLGYSLIMIPDVLRNIAKYFTEKSNVRSQNRTKNGMVIEEDVSIDTLRFQIRNLEKQISEIQT